MDALGAFDLYNAVRVTAGPWWRAAEPGHRGVVVQEARVGILESRWTKSASGSFEDVEFTRDTRVRLTTGQQLRIFTEEPPPLPEEDASYGLRRTVRPRRPVGDRRVVVCPVGDSHIIAVFHEHEGTGLLELSAGQRFHMGRDRWGSLPVSVVTEMNQLAMIARRRWYHFEKYDEFRLRVPIPLELVLLTWHVLSGDYELEASPIS